MVAVGVERSQGAIDTRALEIASEARALVLAHKEECGRERMHVAAVLADIRSAIKNFDNRLWGVAGVSILTLATAVGILAFFLMTHGK